MHTATAAQAAHLFHRGGRPTLERQERSWRRTQLRRPAGSDNETIEWLHSSHFSHQQFPPLLRHPVSLMLQISLLKTPKLHFLTPTIYLSSQNSSSLGTSSPKWSWAEWIIRLPMTFDWKQNMKGFFAYVIDFRRLSMFRVSAKTMS